MQQYYLTEIQTQDKLIHQGIYYKPARSSKKAILWVHGLSNKFYSHLELHQAFVNACEKSGFGYAAFNNRGHDLIASIHKIDKRKTKGYTHAQGGAGQEDFQKSIFDIGAGVDFLAGQGFSQIILAGHSTGANKVSYYAAVRKNSHVAGIVLASPLSDRLDPSVKSDERSKIIKEMENLVKRGKGDDLQLNLHFFPITPKRYISLLKPNTIEDQFDYGDEKPKLKYFKRIKKPILVILGTADEYLDRPAGQAAAVFDKLTNSKNYKNLILLDTMHSFNGQEEKVVKKIIEWVNSL